MNPYVQVYAPVWRIRGAEPDSLSSLVNLPDFLVECVFVLLLLIVMNCSLLIDHLYTFALERFARDVILFIPDLWLSPVVMFAIHVGSILSHDRYCAFVDYLK